VTRWPVLFVLVTLSALAASLPMTRAGGRSGDDIARATSGCDITVDKVASPAKVVVDSEVSITMTVRADCERLQSPVHAVLVFDNSLDMGGSRMRHMREAVMAFADALDLGDSMVGLVAYHGTVEVLTELTHDRDDLEEATRHFFPRPGSNLLAGLQTAGQVLADGHEEGVLEAVVVLSGSVSEGTPEELIAESERLQAKGVLVVTVAGTGNADVETLERMASSPASHYIESQSIRYPSLFRDIARDISTVRLTGAEVQDVVPSNMEYVWGSGIPAPRVHGDTLLWTYAVWPTDGITITFGVQPSELGHHDTNVSAEVELTFERGDPVTRVFPVPRVDVVEPPTATSPPPTVTPTAVPTTPPEALFLPLLLRSFCSAGAPSDVILLVDTSLSMLDRTDAGGVKLEYVQIAATDFVGELGLPQNRAGLVGFGDDAAVLQQLTGDRVSLEVALGRMYGSVTRGSRLQRGFEAAAAELVGDGALDAHWAVVLVTDGVDDSQEAIAAAEEVRMYADVFAIGIGADVPLGWLEQIAGGLDQAYLSPDGSDLGLTFDEVRRQIGCGLSGGQSSQDLRQSSEAIGRPYERLTICCSRKAYDVSF